MASFSDFVCEQVRSNQQLEQVLIDVVLDGDIPLCNVEVELGGAEVKVIGYDKDSRIADVDIVVSWGGDLAADPEGDITEGGTIHGTVQLRHEGKQLAYIGGRYDLRYSMDEDDNHS